VWVLTKSITKHLPIGFNIAQGAKASMGIVIAVIFVITLYCCERIFRGFLMTKTPSQGAKTSTGKCHRY